MKTYKELIERVGVVKNFRDEVARATSKPKPAPKTKPAPKVSVQPKSTPALAASPEVMAARKRRKAKELNATPRLAASPDVQKARDKRMMRGQVRKAPSVPSPMRKGMQVAVNKVKEKMNKPKAAAPQTKTPPQKKTDSPQSVEMKRMRQRYIERQKQNKAQAEKDKTKGGFMGGVRKSLGGDLISKDPDKRREARFNRGKEMADGVKSKIGSLRKIRLQPPSTDTGYSPSEDLRGGAARKFGSSAS